MLIELLLVIAIAVLASMLLPALGRARIKAQGIICLSNTKQLALGWMLYAGDHGDRCIYNGPWANSRAGNWSGLPASYHNGAAGFSFADGHSGIHKWLFATTKLRVTANGSFIGSPYPLAASGNNEWLQLHSSEKR